MSAKLNDMWDGANDVLVWIGCAALIFIMLSVSGDAVVRYIFKSSEAWVVDVSTYLLLLMTFAGTARVLKREEHVAIGILTSQLNPRNSALFSIITSVIGLLVCLVIAWYSGEVTVDFIQEDRRTIDMLGLPKALLIGIVCAGYLLLSIQFSARIKKYLRIWKASVN
ncbi:TRAP transporter small permease [Chloroflexota bacterium]